MFDNIPGVFSVISSGENVTLSQELKKAIKEYAKEVEEQINLIPLMETKVNETMDLIPALNRKIDEVINAQFPPAPLRGAKGDGITDDSEALQILIDYARDLKKILYIPAGRYKITSTLTLHPYSKLVMAKEAIIEPYADVNVIEMTSNTEVTGGRIYLGRINDFSKAGIYFNGENQLSTGQRASLSKIDIYGAPSNLKGAGIQIDGLHQGDNVCWVNMHDFSIKNVEKGIYFNAPDNPPDNPRGEEDYVSWLNGIAFNQFTLANVVYGIYISGNGELPNETSANYFINFQIQTEPPTKRAIYCEGGKNFFQGMIWDYRHKMPNDKPVEFTSQSRWNFLQTPDIPKSDIIDYGIENITISNRELSNLFTIGVPNLPPNPTTKSFSGLQDDALAFANLRYNVQVSGPSIAGGSFNNLFDLRADASATWNSGDEENPIIVEIDLTNDNLRLITNLGLISAWGEAPKYLKAEYMDESSNWVLIKEINNNTKNIIDIVPSPYITRAIKLKYTFYGMQDNRTIIRVNKLYSNSTGEYGKSWLPLNAGKVYGDLDINNNYLILGNRSAIPTAEARHHKKFAVLVRDSYEDEIYYCKKLANNTYEWIRIDKPIIKSPDGSKWEINIDDSGVITTKKI